MKRGRIALLVASGAVVLLLVGGGLGLKVGAADSSYRQVILFSEVLSHVLENYVDPVEAEALLEGAYEGMLSGLDAQGAYLTPEEVEEWKAGSGERLADPGVSVLKAYGAFQVVGVVPGSPADEAGIVPGDQIRQIDGKPLRDLSLDQAIGLLRGRPGTPLTLAVVHRKDFRREDLLLERALRTARPYELGVERGIAVLRVHDLGGAASEELISELEDVQSRGVEKLLLDLRNLVEQDARKATAISGLFVSGSLLSLRDRAGHLLESIEAPGPSAAWPHRLGVLVNGATAGAPEAVARLLQTRRAATVFGESTYGLGAEPKLFELPDGSGLLVSAAVWETASGQRWHGQGIEPNHVIHVEGRGFDEAHAEQLRRALDAFESQPTQTAERRAA